MRKLESLEIGNTLTYGGVEAARYPLDIYAWFRNFLTFVVPLGCVSYFPVAAVLGHADRTACRCGLRRSRLRSALSFSGSRCESGGLGCATTVDGDVIWCPGHCAPIEPRGLLTTNDE